MALARRPRRTTRFAESDNVTAFLDAYRRALEAGELADDRDQASAVEALERLSVELASEPHGLIAGLLHHESPCGIYLWGSVGRGKSMLMDLLFETVPAAAKRRVHFHAFMEEVHAELHAQQAHDHHGDAIDAVAAAFRGKARLLCLDELEIIDITDAVIVGRLFEALFATGMVIVTTSNDAPDDLYRNGPNREALRPFIAVLKLHMRVVRIGGSLDRRNGALRGAATYLCPIDEDTTARFDAAWRHALGDRTETRAEIVTHGRPTRYDRVAGTLLRVTFEDACARPLSADDHSTLAARFDHVFLEGVPRLSTERRDEARRLVTLIDALYEARARLVVLAEAPPDQIFADPAQNDHQRTISRLKEMRGAAWPPEPHSGATSRVDPDQARSALGAR
ncbi:MAG: cell division protein ZapE [Sphingomonas bacterium]